VLAAVTLQCTEVVGVAKLLSKLLENLPVLLYARGTDLALEKAAHVERHPIVVEQCVIDIEQEDQLVLVIASHPQSSLK